MSDQRVPMPGDVREVNGRIQIWSGTGWWDYLEHKDDKILIEERLDATSPVVIWMGDKR